MQEAGWDGKAKKADITDTTLEAAYTELLQGGGVGVLCGELFLLLETYIGKGRGHTAKVKDILV